MVFGEGGGWEGRLAHRTVVCFASGLGGGLSGLGGGLGRDDAVGALARVCFGFPLGLGKGVLGALDVAQSAHLVARAPGTGAGGGASGGASGVAKAGFDLGEDGG